MVVILGNEQVLLSDVLDAGLAGTVYAHPKRRDCAVKIYNDVKYREPDRIEWLCNHPPTVRWKARIPLFAWPEESAYDAGTGDFVGYSMPRVRDALPLQAMVNPRTRLSAVRRPFLWKVAHSILMRLHTIHLMNFIAGDANTKNFLISRRGIVSQLDIDSMHFQTPGGVTWTTGMNRPELQPPELIDIDGAPPIRRQDQDAWTACVLTWRLLHEGQHPFDCCYVGKGSPPSIEERIRNNFWPHSNRHPSYRPKPGLILFKDMPKSYQELMRRMFHDGHADFAVRPTVTELMKCLEQVCPRGTRRARVGRLAWRREMMHGAQERHVRRAISWAGRHKLSTASAALSLVAAIGLPSVLKTAKPSLSGRSETQVIPRASEQTSPIPELPTVNRRTGKEPLLQTPALWREATLPNGR